MNRLANSTCALFVEASLEYQPFTIVNDCNSQARVVSSQRVARVTSSEYTVSLNSLGQSVEAIPKNYKSRELALLQSQAGISYEDWGKKLSQLALMVESNFVRAISFLPKKASSTQVLYAEKYDQSIGGPTWQWLVEPYTENKIGKATSIGSFNNIYEGDRHLLSDQESIAPSLASLPLFIQPNIAEILKEFVLDKQTEAVAITYQNPENNLPVTQLWSKEDKYLQVSGSS